MKNLLESTISRMRVALLLSLPAMFGIARCNSPYDPRLDDGMVTIQPERDAKRWSVDEYGLGPLRAGLSITEAARFLVAGAIAVPEGEEASSCGYADWPEAPAGVFVMLENGRIARIEIDSASVATAAGARVGDTEARIEALYPGRVEKQGHKFTDGRYLIVRAAAAEGDGTDHRIVFETDGRKVLRYRAGVYPAVAYADPCGDGGDAEE